MTPEDENATKVRCTQFSIAPASKLFTTRVSSQVPARTLKNNSMCFRSSAVDKPEKTVCTCTKALRPLSAKVRGAVAHRHKVLHREVVLEALSKPPRPH